MSVVPPSSVIYMRPTSPASLLIVDELGRELWAYDRKEKLCLSYVPLKVFVSNWVIDGVEFLSQMTILSTVPTYPDNVLVPGFPIVYVIPSVPLA